VRGIKLDLTEAAGARFDFESTVTGFSSTVQNILVEIGQKSDTDIIFPEKGNSLHDNGVSGGLVDPEVLGEALRDLSTSIIDFINDTDEAYNSEKLSLLDIDLELWDADQARLNVVATSSTGETIGVSTNV